MNFKNRFIDANNDFLYNKLLDFLDCEVNDFTYKDIIFLLESENVRSMQYEGNQYIITKNYMDSKILIIDEIAEEHGVSKNQSRFTIERCDLIALIQKKIF